MGKAVVRALYKALLAETREMARGGGGSVGVGGAWGTPWVELFDPVDPVKWGHGAHVFSPTMHAAKDDYVEQLFPGLDLDVPPRARFTADDVADVIRREFRRHSADSPLQAQDAIDAGFGHLRALNASISAQKCASVTTTHDVTVELCTAFWLCQPPGVYVFPYRVRISNHGSSLITVVGRHWKITDSEGVVVEVPKGSSGVVGHTPTLKPGWSFEYVSGTTLNTPSGTMFGSLQAIRDDSASSPGVPITLDIGEVSLSDANTLPYDEDQAYAIAAGGL